MLTRKLTVLALGALLSGNVLAAPWTLKESSLICPTKEAYDTQLNYLVQGVKKLVGGCGFTKQRYQVVVLDLNIFSASKVQVIDNDAVVWTAHESLSQ